MNLKLWTHRGLLAVLVPLLLVVLAACDAEDDPSDTADPETADEETAGEETADEETEETAGEETEEVAQGEPVNLRVATFDEGSAWYQYGATLGEVLRQELPAGSNSQVLPFAGGVGNPTLLQDGEADIALSFSVNNLWAYEGRIAYEEAHDQLRGLVGGLDSYYLAMIANASLEAETFQDIVDQQLGINLYTLSPGSQGEQATQLLLEEYGITYEDIESWGGSVENTTFDVITSDFQNGNVDVLIHNITEGHPAITEISVQSDIKMLQIDPDKSQALQDTYGMSELTLPGGSFTGQDEDVTTIGWVTTLVTSADLDEEAAYQITRAFVENRDTFAEAHASLAAFDPQQAANPQLLGVPLHPGAERYYEEAGIPVEQ